MLLYSEGEPKKIGNGKGTDGDKICFRKRGHMYKGLGG